MRENTYIFSFRTSVLLTLSLFGGCAR